MGPFNPQSFGVPQLPKKKKPQLPQGPAEEQAEPVQEPMAIEAKEPTGMESPMGGMAPAEDEAIEVAGGFNIAPEALSYRTADKQCSSCEYFDENDDAEGNCRVLKMPVEQDAGCNAHESKNEMEDHNGTSADDIENTPIA
jgi:hypothetical protein